MINSVLLKIFLRNLSDLNEWIQLENAIDNAKKYIKTNGNHHGGGTKKKLQNKNNENPTELIQNLCEQLERLRDSSKTNINNKQRPPSNITNTPRPRFNSSSSNWKYSQGDNMGVIREEPHFESMIICNTPLQDGIHPNMGRSFF